MSKHHRAGRTSLRANSHPETDWIGPPLWPFGCSLAPLLLILAVLLVALGGCCGMTRGPRVRQVEETVTTEPDGTRTETTITREADGGASTGSAASEMTAGTAQIDDQGVRATGPTRKPVAVSGLRWLYIAGAVVIAGGIVAGLLVGASTGGVIGACGVALLLVARLLEVYPWVALAAAAIGLGAGGYLLLKLWRGKRAAMALGVIVPAVEALPEWEKKAVKEKIEAEAGRSGAVVKDEVTQIKRRLRL